MRPSLNDLLAFAAVADSRSFRKAADGLGVSRSALSHAMRGLEGRLGLRLLQRTTRSVSLTEAGSRLRARLGPVLAELDATLDSLADLRGAPAGRLRINSNKGATRLLLRRAVPLFLARYPAVELDLVTDGRFVDIVADGFDAGIRLLEAVPADMVAVRFGAETRFLPVAAPAYLAGRAPPETPDDLRAHCCIRQRLPSGRRYAWEFERHGTELRIDAPGALTLDDNDLMVEAAIAGLGIAFVPESFAEAALAAGHLVRLLEGWCPAVPGAALYYPGHRLVPAALRAFIDTLREAEAPAPPPEAR